MIQAVAYVRYSSDKQREESIEAQLRAIHAYASKQQIEIVYEYRDEGKSATTDERPAFQQMIRELQVYKPAFVLVHKYDRFARDRFDSAYYKREIHKSGARLVAVDQPLDDSPESILMESLMEGMAEYYSRNLARETMKGMTENAFKAQFNGGWVPLGYDINANKQYVINETEAETVRQIFKMKLEGRTLGAIIKEMNAQGRLTKRGRPFGKNSVFEILRNEKYSGVYCFNKTPKKVAGKRNSRIKNDDDKIIRVEGAVPEIIPREEWEAVQIMMDECKTGPRNIDGSSYVLTGVLRCGVCGGAMTGDTVSKKDRQGERQTYRYYTCVRARKRNGECNHAKQYPADEYEQQVLNVLNDNMLKPKDMNALAERLYKSIQKRDKNKDKQRIELEKQLKDVENKLQGFFDAIAAGVEYKHMVGQINELGNQKEYLKGKLEAQTDILSTLTVRQIRQYLADKQDYDPAKTEDIKRIIAANVDAAILDGDGFEVILKYHFGTSVAGVGGATLHETYHQKPRAVVF